MNSKLYVGNLPFSCTENDLRETFSECGTVNSVKLITDRETGKSKGFAFVEMSSEEEAADVITNFNGATLDGRQMTISIARPKDAR